MADTHELRELLASEEARYASRAHDVESRLRVHAERNNLMDALKLPDWLCAGLPFVRSYIEAAAAAVEASVIPVERLIEIVELVSLNRWDAFGRAAAAARERRGLAARAPRPRHPTWVRRDRYALSGVWLSQKSRLLLETTAILAALNIDPMPSLAAALRAALATGETPEVRLEMVVMLAMRWQDHEETIRLFEVIGAAGSGNEVIAATAYSVQHGWNDADTMFAEVPWAVDGDNAGEDNIKIGLPLATQKTGSPLVPQKTGSPPVMAPAPGTPFRKTVSHEPSFAALEATCRKRDIEAVQDLLAHSRWPEPHLRKSRLDLFHSLCSEGQLELAEIIADEFSITSAEARDTHNFALRWACARGHLSTAMWLAGRFGLTADDARAADNFALREACENGHSCAARWLITHFNLHTHSDLADALVLARRNCSAGVVKLIDDRLDDDNDDNDDNDDDNDDDNNNNDDNDNDNDNDDDNDDAASYPERPDREPLVQGTPEYEREKALLDRELDEMVAARRG
ncbi:MAG: hypothetical protein WC700_04245 [Gemmatimonadaceae bacterium]|jgi:hypothetical protein